MDRSLKAAILAVTVTMTAGSCTVTVGGSQGTVASHLDFGGPPECTTRVTCLLGLQLIYGLHFKSFKALDEVGPVSVAALADNKVQVVRLDSSDPSIPQHRWVILQDDKAFQQAGNIIPVVRRSKATEEVTSLLDRVTSSLTQGDLFMLDSDVGIGGQTPEAAAQSFVSRKGLAETPSAGAKDSVTVGSAAFAENETLAYIYIDVLRSAGYVVNANISIGNREKYEPELESGQIDLLPEYVGNYLTFLNPSLVNVPLSAAVSMLRDLLASKGLTVLDPASATDSDTVVVTKATADKFHLVKISDLGNNYPG